MFCSINNSDSVPDSVQPIPRIESSYILHDQCVLNLLIRKIELTSVNSHGLMRGRTMSS